jgi:hypothetical protein
MELNERLTAIERFMTYMPQFTSGKRMNIPHEERMLMKEIYKDIYGVNVHMSCPPCVENVILKLNDWMEKNRSML